ncbi:hypothetical protein P9112_013899 [Eukaryota sp. TZLM1-RC]
MDFYPFFLDRASAVEPNPGHIDAARSAYNLLELSRVWVHFSDPPTRRILPDNSEATPSPSRHDKVAVHGGRRLVLSPGPEISKPIIGDLSIDRTLSTYFTSI